MKSSCCLYPSVSVHLSVYPPSLFLLGGLSCVSPPVVARQRAVCVPPNFFVFCAFRIVSKEGVRLVLKTYCSA
jgi:hypothetical protein